MTIHMQPTVSYHALRKAALTLEPFVQIYFTFHGIKQNDFFKYFPILVYTEATIYQIDEEYEENTQNPNFESKHLKTLYAILEEQKLLDDSIRQEFANGMKYYALERKMCSGGSFAFEDIAQANKFKCFDFRVLHRLLHKLIGKPCEEWVMDAFWSGEAMVDVEDDIKQYEDDVRRNVYNTYRMMVKLYREQAPQKLKEYIDSLNKGIEQAVYKSPWRYKIRFTKALRAYRSDSPTPKIPQPILTDPILQ